MGLRTGFGPRLVVWGPRSRNGSQRCLAHFLNKISDGPLSYADTSRITNRNCQPATHSETGHVDTQTEQTSQLC